MNRNRNMSYGLLLRQLLIVLLCLSMLLCVIPLQSVGVFAESRVSDATESEAGKIEEGSGQSADEISQTPSTGDNDNVWIWMVFAGVAAVLLIVLTVTGKRGKKK